MPFGVGDDTSDVCVPARFEQLGLHRCSVPCAPVIGSFVPWPRHERAVRGAMLQHLERENEPDLRPRFRLVRQMDHVDGPTLG